MFFQTTHSASVAASTPDACDERRDADRKHMQAFEDALDVAKATCFNAKYGHNQLHLLILATHPEYQRRGAGTRLCRWGMQLAMDRKIPVTLFSSPMGTQLYTSLGFRMVGTVVVRVEGEDDKLTIGTMIFQAD